MKKHFLFIFILLFNIKNSQAQFVTIPDPNFVNWLNSNGFANCMIGNQMDTMCTQVMNATSINCNTMQITNLTGISYFDNLTSLICYNNQLTFIPSLPASLNLLNCQGNQISMLPDLPLALTELNCAWNQLNNLPVLPPTLTSLNFLNNSLTSLPILPSSLTSLICLGNQLTALPVLPSSLSLLDCSGNQLNSISTLPSSLSYFGCSDNQLTALPSLPNSLTELYCGNNQLTTLPTLPASLTNLWCQDNSILLLPVLPPSLIELACHGNQLTSLPVLPATINYLYCNVNQLTTLPDLPANLVDLICSGNQLTSLPELPSYMGLLMIDQNPNLACLPPINYIENFGWTGTAITCLPNNVTIINTSNPSISNIPICDYFNGNGCGVGYNIKGRVFNDSISNCIVDLNEIRHPNTKINLYHNGNLIKQTFTTYLGEFTFDTDTGIFTIVPDTNTAYKVICPISGIHTSIINAVDSIDTDMDFAIGCDSGYDVGILSISRKAGNFRPANYTYLNINAGDLNSQFNLHCAGGITGQVKVLLYGPVTYISPMNGALNPILNGDTLIYNVSDFGNIDMKKSFNIKVQVDTLAQLLQQICFEVWVTPFSDNDPANNHLTQCFNVVNSFDPNDKQVSPEYIQDANGEWLIYTVRFQNTGNAPANHIYILDTLSQFVDASTFELIAYSHEPLIVITGKAVRFNFAGINLPDSISNEPGSHGYVQYRVRSLPALANNTSVENTAYIYFDFNSPVVTNTATSLVHCVESRSISQTICHGESFSFNNVNLQYPGVYLDTIYNSNGCDTIVYLNLNVTYQTINTIQNGNTLQVLNSGTYQWINCNTNTTINGQSSSTFNPTSNGNYAVIVTNGNCVDTSNCINFVISGVEDITSTPIKLSPNPAGEYILLENLQIRECQIILHDITGRVVATINNESATQQLNIASLSKGVYLIEISGKDVYERLYFVKE